MARSRSTRTRKLTPLQTIRQDPRVKSVWSEGEDGWWMELTSEWRTWDWTLCAHSDDLEGLLSELKSLRRLET